MAGRRKPSSKSPNARASRYRTCATRKVLKPPAIAAHAWSRSTANECWRRHAVVIRLPELKSPRTASVPLHRKKWCWNCCCPTCRKPTTRVTMKSISGPTSLPSENPASKRANRSSKMRRMPPSRSTSMRAFSAPVACAPVATSRSMM